MDEEIERLVVSVRADTSLFARDVAAMRAELEGPMALGVERAGQAMEQSLLRAVRTGRFGFEDLKRSALAAMAEIAAAALRSGLGAALGGGGLAEAAGRLLVGLLGAPGRATGGPVSPARPYWVGERGPELFVPTASGRIEPAGPSPGGRDVRLNITIHAPGGTEPQALARSGRQVARAVRQALMRVED